MKHIASATVRIGRNDCHGQGVLIPGGFILTAAHVITWEGEGRMVLGDYFAETVTTKDGKQFRVGPIAIDPVSDIAVLGELDNQEFFDDAEAFEAWREVTKPVPLLMKPPSLRESLKVRVLSHHGKWIKSKIVNYGVMANQSGSMFMEATAQIEPGTSGGPVVTTDGDLVGVVSHAVEVTPGSTCPGGLPIACLALPRWVLLRVEQAQRAKRKG